MTHTQTGRIIVYSTSASFSLEFSSYPIFKQYLRENAFHGAVPCLSRLRDDYVLSTTIGSGPGSSVGIATTCWTVRGSNPGGARFSVLSDRPWGPPSLLNGYRVFPGGKVRPGRAADHSTPSSAVIMEE